LDVAELAQLIEELETRVERLRSVYDQYFMGIERLEPLIMRKDVDRRLWLLRKEQIRNTGMRFKLQTTIQRYNTYQQYWARIVREIENGTYQRDLGRAAARFGENAVTAFGKRRQKMFQRGIAKKAERDAARQGSSTDSDQPPPSGDTFDVAFEDSELFGEAPGEPKGWAGPVAAAAMLDLKMDFAAPKAPPAARAPLPTPPQGSPAMAPPRDAPTPRHGSFPPPPLVAPPPPAKARALPPARAPAPRAPGPPARQPGGALPPVQAPPVRAPVERPPAAVAQPKAPAARPRATPPAGTQIAPDDELSPTRLRQIYGQYVEAKRRANESTAAITYDKIATNLRETAKQLKTKHNGRNVDFEVVMKNGKPVLKPVFRG
jgi:hypothetical protein